MEDCPVKLPAEKLEKYKAVNQKYCVREKSERDSYDMSIKSV